MLRLGGRRTAVIGPQSTGTTLRDHDSLDLFRVRYESHDLFVTVQHDNSRSYVMIRRIQLPRDLEPFHFRIRLHDRRVSSSVICSRTVGWIVTGTDAPRHDITIRDRSEIPAILGIIDHRDNRDVLDPHERGHFGRRRASRGNHRISNHNFRCSHQVVRLTGYCGPRCVCGLVVAYPKAFFVAW